MSEMLKASSRVDDVIITSFSLLCDNLDPWLHLLIDKAGEEKFDFKLSASLEVAKETPLLSGWIFHATPSVLPKPVEMQGTTLC
jgi:hypothetical protein